MKICAIICEYNPFHNGHLYQLRQARALSGADAVVCLMSGDFVQRGEAAILDKYARAKHAVLAGADLVLELPVPFATSNAELFAKGALHILSSIPAVDTLCFGAEKADENAFTTAATLLNNEPKEVSQEIKELTAQGVSFARARATAYAPYLPDGFLTSPNNILGVEYARAILKTKAPVRLLPIERVGGGYNEKKPTGEFSSATAIREAICKGGRLEDALPPFVAQDLPNELENKLDCLEKYGILQNSATKIARVCDCTEGLENAFKKAAELPAPLVQTLTSPRYTSARIRRIALQNLLGIEEEFVRDCLSSPLYLRVLAAKKESKGALAEVDKSAFPLLIRGKDGEVLECVARSCFERELFAEKIYRLLYPARAEKEIFW